MCREAPQQISLLYVTQALLKISRLRSRLFLRTIYPFFGRDINILLKSGRRI